MQNELRLPSQTMLTTRPARDDIEVVTPTSPLVLLAPATPLALALALSLAPLTSTLVGSAGLGAGLGTSILSAASHRGSGGTLLGTAGLGIASGRDAGAAVSTGCGLSTSGSLSTSRSTGRSISTRGSRGASLSGGTGLRSSARRSRARAVQLALDESEGVLAVHVAVALVGGLVAAVTAVRVGAVAVGLHLGAGLL